MCLSIERERASGLERNTNLKLVRLSIAAVFYLLIHATLGLAQGTNRSYLDEARQTWVARQNQIETAKFAFVSKYRVPSDSSMHPQRLDAKFRKLRGEKAANPKEQIGDMAYEVRHILKFDGDKVREYYERASFLTDRLTKNEKLTSLETFDGRDSMALRNASISGRFDRGYIRHPATPPTKSETVYKPILLTYRAIGSPLIQFVADSLRDTEEYGTVDGRRCRIFEEKDRNVQYWVDPSRDYCILRRLLRYATGKPRVQIDVHYESDAKYGPVPVSWTVQRLEENGKLSQMIEVKVNNFEFNLPIPAKEFSIEFPPGTLVIDERSDSQFVLLANGSRRNVKRSELVSLDKDKLLSEPE